MGHSSNILFDLRALAITPTPLHVHTTMKAFTVLATLSAASLALAQGTLIINTPVSIVQCQPVLLTYGGGTAPYFISVLPGGQPAATPLEQLPQQSGTSYTWTADIAAGTNISLSIRDSTGAINYGSPVVIQSSSDSSCLSGGGGAASTALPSASSTISVATTAAASSTLVSSAPSATVTASSGPITGNITQNNGTVSGGSSSGYNFTCSQGDLTYGITTAVLEGIPLALVTGALSNWTAVAPGMLVNSTGSGVGAERTYTLAGNPNITFSETLQTQDMNMTSGSLQQQWNFTEETPVMLSDNLTLYNAFTDLTAYTNTTTNATNVQYFILACFSDQETGLSAIASLIEGTISYFAGALSNATSNSTGSGSSNMRRTVRLY